MLSCHGYEQVLQDGWKYSQTPKNNRRYSGRIGCVPAARRRCRLAATMSTRCCGCRCCACSTCPSSRSDCRRTALRGLKRCSLPFGCNGVERFAVAPILTAWSSRSVWHHVSFRSGCKGQSTFILPAVHEGQ